jgi:hypothetical protein
MLRIDKQETGTICCFRNRSPVDAIRPISDKSGFGGAKKKPLLAEAAPVRRTDKAQYLEREAGRASRGFASFTLMVLPFKSLSFSEEIASRASELFGISMKPKPLERPVNLSMMTFAFDTSPNSLNVWRRSLSVMP